ncbi:hypothetical protein [Thauera sp.]|uniref:hypothetical protein n=1 Tax=Thauera sp. TaxID=1905334 RepID=UPI0039E58190
MAGKDTKGKPVAEAEGVPQEMLLKRPLQYAGRSWPKGEVIKPRELGLRAENVKWLRDAGVAEDVESEGSEA